MKIMCSYAVEIKHINRLFRDTIKIYNDAVSFCVKAFEDHWDVLKTLDPGNKERFAYADHLIHTTKTNTAVFKEFDQKFHKMPSYLRFAVINTAFNDWNWITVSLKHTDVVSIRNHRKDGKISAPILEKKNKKWFLRFAFEGQAKLNDTKLEKRRILAVDLGVNTDAVCSVMTKDGTIHARKFINFAGDKDRIYHTLNKIKKVQKYSGSQNTKKLWRYARFHNDELARKVASKIAETAIQYQCDVIVFEHLDTKGKKKGSKKQKLQMWKKNTIQKIVEQKAHKNGIRISHICAWGTSKLAYDGSGYALRGTEAGKKSYSICRFPNGKTYNCDLSASYNIGARYFIREIQQNQSVKNWSVITAKVPECQKRTQCTYNTLLKINALDMVS